VLSLLDLANEIMLCPGLSLPFVDLNNDTIACDQALKNLASIICKQAEKKQVKLSLPVDYLVSNNGWRGPFFYKQVHEIREGDMMIAIGPQTAASWKPALQHAKTVLFNGPMGNITIPETVQELKAVLQEIAQSSAKRLIGGGSSLAALHAFNLDKYINPTTAVISTGGGAMLAYLANTPLPALDALYL